MISFLVVCGAILLTGPTAALGQTTPKTDTTQWDVTEPRGETRTVEFTTSEGTWMSTDLSPDGEWIVFDLLGHIYRVPLDGGQAEVLTQSSGVAVNYHPRYSPDGETIAFISDRGGQDNLWLMDADGSNPRPVFEQKMVRAATPAWTPDGQYIVVRRMRLGDNPSSGLWMYHRNGGEGVELVGPEVSGASWPSVGPDGRYVYFYEFTGEGTVPWTQSPRTTQDALQGAWNLRRLDRDTGDITPVTAGGPTRQVRLSSGGAYAPEVAPDGRRLAFARRVPDGTISHEGKEFGPRTALWIRDLEKGTERMVMDPITQDVVEGMKTIRSLPGYDWGPEGESIVITQGGKLRRLWVESGKVETIPFEARVHREISEQAYSSFDIPDSPFRSRFLRWHTASPDGSRLAFQAVGRIWVKDLPDGEPRRLTDDSFEPFEFAPAWGPNGDWIAFTTWQYPDGGHLWKVRPSGNDPIRLTETGHEYVHPDWSPDGEQLVLARGSGASFRARSFEHNHYYDLVTVDANGGEAQQVVRAALPDEAGFFDISRSQIVRPTWTDDGRIYYPERQSGDEIDNSEGEGEPFVTTLVSVEPDGSEKQEHLSFPWADEIVPSPDGDWAAFNEGDNVYVVPMPDGGAAGDPVWIDKKNGDLPVRRLSETGGLFPRWQDESTVEFESGPRHFAYDLGSRQTDTTEVELRVPRDRAKGTVALVGARLITLEDDRVIEDGEMVITDGRIRCLGTAGTCDTDAADRRFDLAGKTVIPGFIDMHSHFNREYRGIIPKQAFEAAVPLAYGVTANMDNSMWSQDVFPTAELIRAGKIPGSRTYSTGDPLYAGDGARQNALTSYEVTRNEIDRLQSWGAVSVKQYLQPRRDQRQWVSDIARDRGLMVTSEGSSLVYNLGMIMDGQTAWEHPLTYVPLYSDVTRFLGQAEAVYSPTLVVGGPGPWNDEYFFQEYEVWKNDKLRRWMPWKQLVPHSRRRMLRPETDYSYPMLAEGVADVIEAGGYAAIGAHGQQHGIASHWEVWMLSSALGPMGALEVASKHGAYFLGAQDDLGSLAEGKLADLIVLNSNPLEDIHNTLDMEYVIQGGRVYDDETLDQIWPTQRPYGIRPWIQEKALKTDERPVDYWDRREENTP